MKNLFLALAAMTAATFAHADSAWDLDSCMENIVRQFSCRIQNQDVSFDLEDSSTTQVRHKKAPGKDKIYGLLIRTGENLIYVSCDDSSSLEQVQLVRRSKSPLRLVCQ